MRLLLVQCPFWLVVVSMHLSGLELRLYWAKNKAGWGYHSMHLFSLGIQEHPSSVPQAQKHFFISSVATGNRIELID